MDTLCLCDRTAFRFWHSLRTDGSPRLGELTSVPRQSERLGLQPCRIRKPPIKAPDGERPLRDALRLLHEHAPLNLLVASPSGRRNSELKRCAVWSAPLPPGSVVRIARKVYAVTPEFLLLRLAVAMPLFPLLDVLYELCGSYATGLWGCEASNRCQPLTTRATLDGFLTKAAGSLGVKPLRRVLPYLADGSGSPMETALVLLLCLPLRWGGYGLPLPLLNPELSADAPIGSAGAPRRLFPDLFWPTSGVALEYDGRPFHLGSEATQRDYRRANEFQAQGISIDVLTAREVFDVEQFDIAARRIARKLGIRLRAESLDTRWHARRRQLRKELFDRDNFRQELMGHTALLEGFWPEREKP